MAESRFEGYVKERVAELASAKRAKLKAAYDAEVAEVERRRDGYMKTVEDGVEALVRKVAAQVEKDGCDAGEAGSSAKEFLSEYMKDRLRATLGLQQKYDYDSRAHLWPEGTPVRKAQDALRAFDAFCAKEARRIVVYKMDLGMKPEKFEAMLAETAKKIQEA